MFRLLKEDFVDWESSGLAVHLFGTFALRPNEFVFWDTEKQLLYKIAAYVNLYEDSSKKFRYSFVLDESITEKIENQFPVGRFFTKPSVYKNVQDFRSTSTQTEVIPSRGHNLLNNMIQSADRNFDRKPAGHRFPENLKQFSDYIRLIGGPLTYETLHRNFELALPSLNSVNRYIRKSSQIVYDGQLRVNELHSYLKKRDLPMTVSLSEDATRINGRPQYDKKSNQIHGFIVPTDAEIGMPIPFSFPARNCDEIYHYFESNEPLAGFVNVIMAQPLADVAPFCLLIFSSGNKYTTQIVINRWNFVTKELKKQNISVICIASDSDPRYNSAMRKISQLGHSSGLFSNCRWFNSGSNYQLPVCIQDPPHVATKCRNQLLKSSYQKLRFGSRYYIKIEHLQRLIQIRPKDEHWLTPSDLYPVDKQNYASVLKICDPRVIDLLNKYIPESKGTATFLQIIRDNIDTFANKQLTPLQKIGKLWYNVFILRMWRQYVLSTKNLSLKNNFLTQNCYSCFEINFELPTKQEIYNQIEICKLKAIKDAKELGFCSKIGDDTSLVCKLSTCKLKESAVIMIQNKVNMTKPISSIPSNRMYLRKFAHKFVNKTVDETSSYIEMRPKSNNERIIVKKTSLCWALSKISIKLSSDRMIRVREYR